DLIELVRQHIVENRRFTITELSNHLSQISRSFVHEIVTKHLLFKKLCAEKPDNDRVEDGCHTQAVDFYDTGIQKS
ncbi:hypothetical protein C0J52_07099, partial [Blattella germanica]